jgi:hypothetical protein
MPEAFGYHREKDAKPYARGTRTLLPAQREFQKYLFDRLPKPIYTGRAAILRNPAFQAGCRGFEPRLPLLPLQLCLMKALIRLVHEFLLLVYTLIM